MRENLCWNAQVPLNPVSLDKFTPITFTFGSVFPSLV